MKLLSAIAALGLLAACSAAPPQTARPLRVTCTTVAWNDPAKPIVHASINGHDLTFFVDTGAEYDGWIKPEVARALGLPVVGTVPSEGEDDPTGGLPYYGAQEVRVGGMTFTGRKFGEMPQLGSKPQPFDGLIGNGLFAQLQAVFDYQRGTLTLTEAKLRGGRAWPFKYGIPKVDLRVGPATVAVDVDTGNVASKLFVTSADAVRLRFAGEPVKKGRAMTIAGPLDIYERALADPVHFGATRLGIASARYPGAFNDAQLGSPGMAGQTLRIDYRNRHVTIAPESRPAGC